jgi:hypothetical protein
MPKSCSLAIRSIDKFRGHPCDGLVSLGVPEHIYAPVKLLPSKATPEPPLIY